MAMNLPLTCPGSLAVGKKKSTDPPPRLLHCRSAAVANVSLLVDLMKHTLRDLCDLHAEAANFVVQDGTQPPIP